MRALNFFALKRRSCSPRRDHRGTVADYTNAGRSTRAMCWRFRSRTHTHRGDHRGRPDQIICQPRRDHCGPVRTSRRHHLAAGSSHQPNIKLLDIINESCESGKQIYVDLVRQITVIDHTTSSLQANDQLIRSRLFSLQTARYV